MSRLRNSEQGYGIIAQALHWCMAPLVLAQFGLGLYAAGLPVSLARLKWLSYHKSLGIMLLALMLARLAWHLIDPPPALPGSMAQWEQRAARATHFAIYFTALLAMLAGWLYASAAGLSINWFGLLLIPDLVAKDTLIAPLYKDLHQTLVLLLALLLAGHIGAALRHSFVLRDNVTQRMLPAAWRKKG